MSEKPQEKIPVMLMTEAVTSGFPSPAAQYVEQEVDVGDLLVPRPEATYLVYASGDSMTEAGIQDGDLLVVDRSAEVHSGSIVVACLDGGHTVKYFRQDRKGARLEPANPKYKPIPIPEDIELIFEGVVTAIIRLCQVKRYSTAPRSLNRRLGRNNGKKTAI